MTHMMLILMVKLKKIILVFICNFNGTILDISSNHYTYVCIVSVSPLYNIRIICKNPKMLNACIWYRRQKNAHNPEGMKNIQRNVNHELTNG